MSSCKKYKLLKNMKNVLVVSVMTVALTFNTGHADERSDVQALVKELDYLIEVSVKMQRDYGKQRQQRVRFNYQALINQLKTTRQNTAAFLNEKGTSIQTAPPAIIDHDLYNIK